MEEEKKTTNGNYTNLEPLHVDRMSMGETANKPLDIKKDLVNKEIEHIDIKKSMTIETEETTSVDSEKNKVKVPGFEKISILINKIQTIENNIDLQEDQRQHFIKKLVRNNRKTFIKMIRICLLRNLWTERSGIMRIIILALFIGLIVSTTIVFIMAFLVLLSAVFWITASGGAFVGLIVGDIEKEIQKRRTGLKP